MAARSSFSRAPCAGARWRSMPTAPWRSTQNCNRSAPSPRSFSTTRLSSTRPSRRARCAKAMPASSRRSLGSWRNRDPTARKGSPCRCACRMTAFSSARRRSPCCRASPGRGRDRRHLLRRLRAVEHAVLSDDFDHGQPIIGEDLVPALALRPLMPIMLAPAPYRVGIAPEGQRENLAFGGEALKPFDRDEAVDLLQIGAQHRSDVEIILFPPGLRLDLEDDGMHRRLRLAAPDKAYACFASMIERRMARVRVKSS